MRKVILTCCFLIVAAATFECASKVNSTITAEVDGGYLLPDGAFVAFDGSLGDGSAPTDLGYTSGTRLRARVYASSDGAEEFIDWYDNERKEECGFHLASDGINRCMPTNAIASGVFGDSACKQLLAYNTKGCAAPTSAYGYASGACGVTYQIYAVAGAFSGTTVYSLTGAPDGGVTCSGSPASNLTPAYDLYSVGAEIPASSFQDATINVK